MNASLPADLDGGYLPADDLILAEQIVVGSAMGSSTRAAEDLADVVRPEHFHRPAHATIFAAIQRLADAGAPVDAVAVMAELTRTGDLARCGGADYLHDCLARSSPSAGWHARRVRDDFHRRALHAAAVRIQQATADPAFSLPEALEDARSLVDGVGTAARTDALPSMSELATSVLSDLESGTSRGVPTGISRDLDQALAGGLVPGQLVLVAARPGCGKSICVTQSAAAIAERTGAPVLLASLEMSAEEITTRLLAAEARVPLMSLLQRQVDDAGWARLAVAHSRVAAMPLRIDYAPGCTLAHLRSRLRGLARSGQPALLAVDYVQLLAAPREAQSRQEAVAANARDLKNLAGQLGIPVLAAVQLNRNSEKRTDKRPELADLRESGELEQAADVVILLHREDLYNPESPRAGEMDLMVRKNRQGPPTTVTVAFQGHYSRVRDMARVDDDMRASTRGAA